MCIFTLIKAFWDVKKERPSDIKPAHGMMYFYIINLANSLNWLDNFGLPTDTTMEACGINSYKLYKKTLSDLCDFGLIEMVELSKNQFTSNRIALVKKTKATTKATTKASSTHLLKQVEYNNTNKDLQNNKDLIEYVGDESPTQTPESKKKPKEIDLSKYPPQHIESFNSFNAWLDTEAYNLRKIPEQMNIDNYLKIFKDFKAEIVKETILELHNRPEYCNPKKTHSVNLTLQNWIRRNIERQQQKTTNKNYQNEYTPRISKTEWEAKTGQKYLGQDDPNA
jgi:hypothetical protein